MTKKPDDCDTMEEARAEIDRVDAAMADLLAERWGFVAKVASLKSSAKEASVPWRNDEIITRVRSRVEAGGGPPELAETIWREILDFAIKQQQKNLNP